MLTRPSLILTPTLALTPEVGVLPVALHAARAPILANVSQITNLDVVPIGGHSIGHSCRTLTYHLAIVEMAVVGSAGTGGLSA